LKSLISLKTFHDALAALLSPLRTHGSTGGAIDRAGEAVDRAGEAGAGYSDTKPNPTKVRTRRNTWLSVLGARLTAEGRRARRRRNRSIGVWREGSSWIQRAWRAARMVV
jgi:hypothetical protein